ncbi:ATP-binding protein [Sphingomonas sediminicola]|uniref:ATP-binding protein n=1 Tax=Sphingomonas sediminicola TaxID=386874 RepID=A0ABX6T985_9SPHN|nr:ATP-binding protein [Sphingomonas sediminicola]QNP45570.1 ATP-binding protein [Sphingomonas sediminicola]
MMVGYAPGELEATIASSRLEQSIVQHKLLFHGLQRLRLHQARSLKLFEGSSQPSHLLIVTGLPGAGKSTLLKQHKRDFPDVETIDGRMMPVVLVEMPFPCTRKGLVEAILMAMGHEPSANWNTARIVDEIANFARRHDVLMIAIDEADRIFGSEAPILAKFLVSLLNSLDCQLVLAGAPEIQQLHKGWGLERRKEVDLNLDPYRFNTREGQTDFRSMLGLFEENMGLPEPSLINSPDFSKRLYLASGGRLASSASSWSRL